MTPFFNDDEGKKALATQDALVLDTYAAIAGWGCSALLCAGLVATYLYFKPLADDGTAVGEEPRADDRPTHRIE